MPPEKARQFLDLLSDPDVKTWLERKIPAAPNEREVSIADSISGWEAAIRDHVIALVSAVPRIPHELANAADIVTRDVNSGRPGLVLGILALLIALGFGAEYLIRWALSRAQKGTTEPNAGQAVLSEVAALLTFALASAGTFMAFEWPPLLRRIVLTLLLAVIGFRVVRAAADQLVFARAGALTDKSPPLLESHAADFWSFRVSLISGVFLVGWAIVSLTQALGFSPEVGKLVALAFGLGLLGIAIDIAWRRQPSLAKRILLTLYLAMLWVTWVGGLLVLLWLGIFSLVLPTAVRGVGRLAAIWAASAKRKGPLGVILEVVIVRGA